MHRHNHSEHTVEEPLPKKLCVRQDYKEIKAGAILSDNLGTQWKLGKTIGTGGFGQIYLASRNIHREVKPDANYVAKVEGHTSGPLFVEINYYLRAAKWEMIEEWKQKSKIESLGVPHYVSSGSQQTGPDSKSRFLILPRFERDLEQIFMTKRRKFNLKTVLTIGIQLMDILEYIHSKGFIHSDIKASNLLVGNCCQIVQQAETATPLQHLRGCNPVRTCRNRKPHPALRGRNLRNICHVSYNEDNSDEECENEFEENPGHETEECDKHTEESSQAINQNQIYVLDYGLASKYVKPNGDHKEYCSDNRRAHAGTTLFCSLDAHSGSQSRRSDLESLGYNMIYWLTSHLPWMDDIDDPELVEKKKQKCMSDLKNFMQFCFGQYPRFMYEYLEYVRKLRFDTKPNYAYCKKLFAETLKDYGYQDDNCFDFDNLQGWGKKAEKSKKQKNVSENLPPLATNVVISKIYRQPLRSNLTVAKRSLTRNKKNKSSKRRLINWSKILMDPEEILKRHNKGKHVDEQHRIRRITENSDGNDLMNLDIWRLNPTPTMVQVFDRIKERLSAASGIAPKHRGDYIVEAIEGYTPTMVAVHNRKKEREQEEYEMVVINNNNNKQSGKAAKRAVSRKTVKPAQVALKKQLRATSSTRALTKPTSVYDKKKKHKPSVTKAAVRRITRSCTGVHNLRN